jgi:hypothetical protein
MASFIQVGGRALDGHVEGHPLAEGAQVEVGGLSSGSQRRRPIRVETKPSALALSTMSVIY